MVARQVAGIPSRSSTIALRVQCYAMVWTACVRVERESELVGQERERYVGSPRQRARDVAPLHSTPRPCFAPPCERSAVLPTLLMFDLEHETGILPPTLFHAI
jgi:hypothetical protein